MSSTESMSSYIARILPIALADHDVVAKAQHAARKLLLRNVSPEEATEVLVCHWAPRCKVSVGAEMIEEVVERAHSTINNAGMFPGAGCASALISSIATQVLEGTDYLCDQPGNKYRYNGSFWSRVSVDQMYADIYSHIENGGTSAQRREVAKSILERPEVQAGEIPWNQLGRTEIPFKDGVLDISTDGIREHLPIDYLDKVVPRNVPTKDSGCQVWLQCLEDWFRDDDECALKIASLQEFFGYILLGHARFKKALVLFGDTDTGKSAVLKAIELMVGMNNVTHIPPDKLGDSGELEAIVGKMVNYVSELPESALVHDGGFKSLVSTEEPVLINRKFKDRFSYVPTCKHVIATNNLPGIRDKSAATFNRLLIVKFNRRLVGLEIDRNIGEKIAGVVSGITRWALAGAKRLTANDGVFTQALESTEAVEAYRAEQNPLSTFFEDYMIEDSNSEAGKEEVRKLFNEVNKCNMNAIDFGKSLKGMGVKTKRPKVDGRNKPAVVIGWRVSSWVH